MTTTFENQVFVSYAREHRDKVEALIGQFRNAGVAVWWDKEIELGDNWAEKLEDKIKESRHFLLYCNVEAKASEKVNHEIKTFRESAKNDPSRKLFVLRAPDCAAKHVPQDLGEVQHASSVIDVIVYVLREARNEALQDLGESKRQAASEKAEMRNSLLSNGAKSLTPENTTAIVASGDPSLRKATFIFLRAAAIYGRMKHGRGALAVIELTLINGTTGLSQALLTTLPPTIQEPG